MRNVPEHVTSEQLWIARLFDASCRDGQAANGRRTLSRAHGPRQSKVPATGSATGLQRRTEAPLPAEVHPRH